MLILLTTTSKSQSDSVYFFTPSEVKEIAYRIKSREILMQDTSYLRTRIANLSSQIKFMDSVSILQEKRINQGKVRESIMLTDISSLADERDVFYQKNIKLEKRNKVLKGFLGVSFILGVLTTLALSN